MSQVLPNPLGDAVRVSIAVRRGVGLRESISSAVIERAAMVIFLLLLVTATQPMLHARATEAQPKMALILLVGGFAALGIVSIADRLMPRLRAPRLIATISALSQDFRTALSSPWTFAVAATALLGNLNLVLAARIVGAALHISLSSADYLAIMPLALFAMILPISIAGWGVREGVMMALFRAMGLPSQAALAFSLLYGLSIGLSALPGLAILWLPHARRAAVNVDRRPSAEVVL
jgi:hypothetical protein